MNARRLTLVAAASLSAASFAFPAAAGAYATAAPPLTYSSTAGLPDGRVYELATPANKFGNEVAEYGFLKSSFGVASADGNAVLYEGEGPLNEGATSGNGLTLFVSQRTAHGWATRSATPRGAPGVAEPEENNGLFLNTVSWFLPSTDLSHLAFSTQEAADVALPDDRRSLNNFYLAGPDTSVEPIWVARSLVGNPAQSPPGEMPVPIGGSTDLSTIYFMYPGTENTSTLLPEEEGKSASELYEWRNGILSDAGVLPGGTTSPSRAIPAAQPAQFGQFGLMPPAQFANNQVSVDGSRAFFIRSDSEGTTELYVHETAADGTQRSVLVSQSQLPGHVGEPASDGPLPVPTTEWMTAGEGGTMGPPWYVFATPDGSHAFFRSADRLTSDAPAGAAPKTYEFDLETEQLEYLPGATGSIVAVSHDGSSFVFENTASAPYELDRWTAGPNGGAVTPIVQLPTPANGVCGIVCVGPAQISTNGSVVVFSTESPIAGFNDEGDFKQVFRYDAAANELSCVSCPPHGVVPSGDAIMSNMDQIINEDAFKTINSATDTRAVSTGDDRVFFDTPDSLAPQDANGVRDVYEWENGTVFLLSGGASTTNSIFIGTGESGGDAFFTTTDGLVRGDNDGARDIYDARVPRPGDNPPPEAVPCQGDVCQGPPSVPQLLGAPASATFNGLGNLAAPTQPAIKVKAKAKPKQKARTKRKHSKSRKKGKKATKSQSHGLVEKSNRRGK
jgi:hypothetical protein